MISSLKRIPATRSMISPKLSKRGCHNGRRATEASASLKKSRARRLENTMRSDETSSP